MKTEQEKISHLIHEFLDDYNDFIMTQESLEKTLNEICRYNITSIVKALESHGFTSDDYNDDTICMTSVLGNKVHIKRNKFFGSSFTVETLAGKNIARQNYERLL